MTTPVLFKNFVGKPRWFRSGCLVVGFLAALALVVVDGVLKSSDVVGIRTPSATWQLETANLPEVYARWQELEPYGALQRNAPGALQAVAVSIRKMTGVRPTPGRLRFWLGERVLLAGGDGGWCLSFRPGLAFRTATLLATPPFKPVGVDQRDGQVCPSGWRDGFFLVASSQAYLDRVFTEGTPVAAAVAAKESVAFSWEGLQPGTLEISARESLPLSLVLPGAVAPAVPAALIPAGWEEATFWASLHGRPVSDLAGQMAGAVAQLGVVHPSWERFAPVATAWWAAYCPMPLSIPEDEPWVVGLFESDFRSDIPTLEMVLAKSGARSPLVPDELLTGAPVHRWNDTEGRLLPVAGSARAWAVADSGEMSYLASGEHLVPVALDGGLDEAPGTVAAIEFQWAPLADALSGLLTRAAKEELLRGVSREDVSRTLVPVLDAMGHWGALRIQIRASDSGSRGEGYLAQTPESV